MIQLFISLLPYALLGYFFYRYFQEPIYLLAIPFLMFLRFSVFFDRVRIFSIPGRLGPEILLVIWLFIVWIFISVKNRNIRNRIGEKKHIRNGLNLLDYVNIALIVLSVLGLALVLNENYIVDGVFFEFVTLLSLFIGYFIVRNIVLNTKLPVLAEFLYSIVIVNSIASLLYFIHQGLHITLYTSGINTEEYMEDFFQGEIITRTFWFMPVLWFYSISYLLVFKRSKSVEFISLLSINSLAIFISYTRSSLLIAFLIVVAYFLITGYKTKDLANIVKNLLVVCVTGVVLFMAISVFLPASKDYFFERFKELDKSASDAESNTFIYRLQQTGEVIGRIAPDKVIIGYGPLTEIQMPFVAVMRFTTSDMAWTGVVFRWGYLGLAIFALLFISSIIKAYLLFIRTEGVVSQLALLLLLTIVAQLIESFISWTFLSPNRFALGLWYFGILSAILVKSKANNVSISNE